MSLQPSDPAADAFERLRTEVALLRRAVEGLAAGSEEPPVDYSPTLAELSEGLEAVGAQVTALGERPLLALAPEQLGALFQAAAGKVLARPLADLDRARATLNQAVDALKGARQADLTRTRRRRWMASLLAGGVVSGAVLWSLLLGPLARTLPATWGVPDRLAAATLDLPMQQAGERLLRDGDPQGWSAMQTVRQLPPAQLAQLRDCLSRPTSSRSRSCTVQLSNP